MIEIPAARRARYLRNCRILAVLSTLAALLYLKWLLFDARPESLVLFALLVSAEVFNVLQAAGFWFTICTQRWSEPAPVDFGTSRETVDIFITVCGEPEEIVEGTIRGALAVRHPRKTVWVLDDGRSPQIEFLARSLGARYLIRGDRRGAKAGNINEALRRTKGDFVVILDADHVPKREFLERTLGGFADSAIAFVQTPQVYENRGWNRVAAGSHEQQALFYGPILRGKAYADAVFSCGTNVVFRRSALAAIGGMPEDSITEDLRVSLILLRAGYRSEYVPEVLAKGMGPVDVFGYFRQQDRWAAGGLEILFRRSPFFRQMRIPTAIQYGLSFAYWFTGWAYVSYLILPMAYLLFGQRPVQVPNQYPVYFLPYIVTTLLTMAYAADFQLTFRAVWFTLGSFPVHIAALRSAVLGRSRTFLVTSKGEAVRSLRPVRAHIIALLLLGIAAVYGSIRMGLTPAVMNNVAFVLGHTSIVAGFARYARRPDVHADEIPAEEPAWAEEAGGSRETA